MQSEQEAAEVAEEVLLASLLPLLSPVQNLKAVPLPWIDPVHNLAL